MTERPWLIDKSALVRVADSADVDEWNGRIERGLVRITNVTRLEVGYSARSGTGARRDFRRSPLGAMPVEYLTPAIEDRALEVQMLLADIGQHRGASIPDLLIAAAAELVGLTVLHVDKDFDVISELTGQPTHRLTVPAALSRRCLAGPNDDLSVDAINTSCESAGRKIAFRRVSCVLFIHVSLPPSSFGAAERRDHHTDPRPSTLGNDGPIQVPGDCRSASQVGADGPGIVAAAWGPARVINVSVWPKLARHWSTQGGSPLFLLCGQKAAPVRRSVQLSQIGCVTMKLSAESRTLVGHSGRFSARRGAV
jgi:predicted nucleic acid-binding protein